MAKPQRRRETKWKKVGPLQPPDPLEAHCVNDWRAISRITHGRADARWCGGLAPYGTYRMIDSALTAGAVRECGPKSFAP